MLRIIFISLVLITACLLFLQEQRLQRSSEKPVFLTTDPIALAHQTNIEVSVVAAYQPDSFQLIKLKADYANLWAHLNHLYATNEVVSGKEYYTEGWFKQLCSHYNNRTEKTGIQRKDLSHHLIIQNWSSDGLVCTAIDSNVVLQYSREHQPTTTTKAALAIVLLYQGDHWRIDALRVLNEVPAQ